MSVWKPEPGVIDWLLEPDEPAVRALALRHLLDRPADDPDLRQARAEAHRRGPIAILLDAMHPEGYWERPGFGYGPKYRSTVWAIITLGALGAAVTEDGRVARACAYVLDHTVRVAGRRDHALLDDTQPNWDCLQGNLVAALLRMGCEDDPRLDGAIEWTARAVTGEGVAPAAEKGARLRYTTTGNMGPLRYSATANIGPNFVCTSNWELPCAWGAVKVLLALSLWPEARRTPEVNHAIEQGAAFLLETDPLKAEYPTRTKPDPRWWRFGFPLFYAPDLLQLAEALVGLGYGADPRLAGVLDLVRSKADDQGRWPLEVPAYGKREWIAWGRKGAPNKWVTLRALRVLKAAEKE